MSGPISMDAFLAAQRKLRDTLGKPPETFEPEQIASMLSDEIGMLRDAGRSDADIAALISDGVGHRIDAATVDANYAPPGERRR